MLPCPKAIAARKAKGLPPIPTSVPKKKPAKPPTKKMTGFKFLVDEGMAKPAPKPVPEWTFSDAVYAEAAAMQKEMYAQMYGAKVNPLFIHVVTSHKGTPLTVENLIKPKKFYYEQIPSMDAVEVTWIPTGAKVMVSGGMWDTLMKHHLLDEDLVMKELFHGSH